MGAPEFHTPLIAAGTVWVAEAADRRVVGFLSAERFDGALHIWELAVSHEAQQRGLGRRLIDEAIGYARDAGLSSLTLTTFADVPWNAPFYSRVGFDLLEPDADARLTGILRQETERGLPRRCAMRLAL